MTVREIQFHLEEMYGTEISPSLISSITDAVADGHRGRLPESGGAAVHRAHGAAQPELRVVEAPL